MNMPSSKPQPTLELRSIGQLLNQSFVIPSYQRGYRWTKRQVAELLDDLYDFQRTSDQRPKEAFYCLQPVVVRQHHDEHGAPVADTWELIDGQQRLTTIRLILTALRSLLEVFGKTPFTLAYESRPLSAEFLDGFDEARQGDNIDFQHLYDAYKAIEAWFKAHDAPARIDILRCLTSLEDRNVKVIWYQLPDAEEPIEVFIRLNVGKIALTNAELIRAVLLRELATGTPSTLEGRLQIANEWDSIEKQLRDESFWHFIHRGASPYPARIEYLFVITVQECNLAVAPHDEYATFLAYDAHVRATSRTMRIEGHWREIRNLFQRLEEWRNDRELYHLIGYLVATTKDPSCDLIVQLLRERKGATRSQFVQHLRSRISMARFGNDLTSLPAPACREHVSKHLDGLTYAKTGQRPEIRYTLLLFNVATLLSNLKSDMRFQFHHFEQQPWDLEHVRSVKSEMPGRADDQKSWLSQLVAYWGDAEDDPEVSQLREAARAALSATPFDVKGFPVLYEQILTHFNEIDDNEVHHGIANLVLLDSGTNRGYKNAVFPVKRGDVIALAKSATYVPIGTTNVFLKYYSERIDQMMFWSANDAECYRAEMVNVLANFLQGAN